MVDYEVAYTTKDLILYALSLGMGSQADDTNELKFLYERDDKFTGVPTFCFAFTFWAKRNINADTPETTTQRIPRFPPPIMSDEEVIPSRFLRNNTDISNLPVIHTWQSIVWHQPLEVPTGHPNRVVKTKINSETINIQPKSIGTFVTSQSKVTKNYNRQPLCTIQSTALVLGIDAKKVITFDAAIPRLTCKPKIPSKSEQIEAKQPIFEWTYQTSQSQALLYRMSSGDSNHIHVDTSASDMLGSDKNAPLLHGLFTLALAFRAIVKLFDSDHYRSSLNKFGDIDDYALFFRKLEGAFKAPGFVGDCLCVKIWNHYNVLETVKTDDTKKRFLFMITNSDTGAKLVDNGFAEIEVTSKLVSSASKSRL
mmetsp:Transcript_8999/g.17421  ORF Transcript_8999/g.17421 Transcript_8999/m.17421 type:complete len:367 (-) Transcript_8999:1937-3037(-)